LDSERHDVFVASLGDRFGDLGVVAAIVTTRHPDGTVEIDSFIMSCRAMGYGLERLALAEVMDRLGAARYTARFVPTPRNGPAAGLYRSNGFTETEAGMWTLASGQRVERPAWFGEGAGLSEARG
jgi:predicted enzyme involved in methoxymalonyl-ACP biosynthesis